jgi:hypothetical protein
MSNNDNRLKSIEDIWGAILFGSYCGKYGDFFKALRHCLRPNPLD